MKRYLSNFFPLLIIGLIIAPQITLAAWWNPSSWFKNTIDMPKSQPKIATPSVNKENKSVQTAQTKLAPVQKSPTKVPTLQQVQKNKVELLEANRSLSNRNIIAKVKPAVVYIETEQKSGSGMIIESTGYILTNAHVVSDSNTANVTLSDGRKFIATIVGRDENIDLALLKIYVTGLPVILLGDSNSIEQGDPVFALGYPLGLEGDVSFKDGTLSRRLLLGGVTYLEISAQILPGNSGGPLVDEHGNVIGVNTLAIGTKETLKFALPINIAKNLIPELKNGRNIILPKITLPTLPSLPAPLPTPTPQPYTPPQVISPTPAPIAPPAPTPPTPTPIPKPTPSIPTPVVISQGSQLTLFRFKLSDGDYMVKSLTFSKAVGGGDPAPTIIGMYLGYKLSSGYIPGTDCRSSAVIQSPIKSEFDSLNEITFVFPTPNTCKEFFIDIQTGYVAPTSGSIQYNLIGGELRTLKDNLLVVAPQYSTTINYGTPTPPSIYLGSYDKKVKVGTEFAVGVLYLKNGAHICDIPITYSGHDTLEKTENTGTTACEMVIRYIPTTPGAQTLTIKAQGLEKTIEIEVQP